MERETKGRYKVVPGNNWATILQRMYERFCEKKGWKSKVLHQSFGDPGPEGRIGTKSVSLEIQGQYAYGLLKRETGIHRLVRMSPFSAKQLRHTSFAAIDVAPEIDIKQEQAIELKPDDLEIDLITSTINRSEVRKISNNITIHFLNINKKSNLHYQTNKDLLIYSCFLSLI